MRIVVDYDLCESNGLCEAEAPDLFHLEDDDTLTVLVERPAEDRVAAAERAVIACPKQAITLVDD